MKDAKHPIWALLRILVFMFALVVILYVNASSFDKTELRTIIGMFIVAASGETLTGLFTRKF